MEACAQNLAGAVQALREDVEALRGSLMRAGVLSHQQYTAEVHRRRFAAVQEQHSFGPGQQLTDALQEGGLVERLALQYWPWEISALAPASHASRPLARAIAAAWWSRWRALVCICGGRTGDTWTGSMEGFDPERGTWETLPQMSTDRAGAAVAALRNQIYVCGGDDDDNNTLSSVERFDPDRSQWEVLPPMNSDRYFSAAAGLGGRLYICGGADADGHVLSTAERFDPELDRWEVLVRMGSSRYNHAAATVGGRLYVCGGEDDDGNTLNSLERFDPDRNLWEALPPMGSTRRGLAAVALGGRLYICGGTDADGYALSSAERFDPELNQWEALALMGSAQRSSVGAAVGGRLYMCGGLRMECFDPAGNVWEAQPPMNLPRVRGAAATFCMPRPTLAASFIGSSHAGRGPDGQAPVNRRRLG